MNWLFKYNILFAHLLFIAIALLSLAQFNDVELARDGRDKFLHMLAYGSAYFVLAYRATHRKKEFLLACYAAFIGIIMEVAQHYLPYRTASFYDALANIAGIVLAALLLQLPVIRGKN